MNRTIAEWQRKIDELRARGPFLMWELRVAELRYSPDQPRDASGRFDSVNGSKGVDISEKSSIIKTGSGEVVELRQLGTLDTQPLEKEFGKLKTDEVIVTEERILHIKAHHPQDYELFEKYGVSTVEKPDIIIKDTGNENTVFMIKHLESTNLNVIIKLILEAETEHPDYKNSVMSFYRIRNRNLEKLEKKHKVLYKNE